MAIKIHCSECKKQISIDSAFAGGVCRCPYCAAIVPVEGGSGDSGNISGLPRPEAPSAAPASPQPGHADQSAAVPMAKPVKSQGIAAIVMAVLALALIAGVVIVVMKMKDKDLSPTTQQGSAGANKTANDGSGASSNTLDQPPIEYVEPVEDVNPFVPPADGAAMVAGITVETPVLFCIDTGSTMRVYWDYAVAIARVSVRPMKADQKFNVMFFTEGDDEGGEWFMLVAKKFSPGGSAGEELIKQADVSPGGATDLSVGLKAAFAQKPRTIVLFVRKDIEDILPLGSEARSMGIKIITIALDADPSVKADLAKLADACGGESRAYSSGQLQRWTSAAPLLD